MPLDPQQRSEFVDAYTRLLITTWSSEEFSARLLAEYGVRPSAETRDLIEAVKLSREIRFTPQDKRSPRPPSKPAS